MTGSRNLRLSDAGAGDTVLVDGVPHRLMIKMRGGWLVRPNRVDEHVWMNDTDPIDEIVHVQQKRNPKAKKAKGRDDINDPIG